MSSFSQPSLHSATPTLSVIDARELQIRSIAYHCSDATQTPEARITRQAFDAHARLESSWDPRLFSAQQAPNLATRYSLSALPLLTKSVDAGWRLKLMGNANQLLCEWDGRQSQRLIGYDNLLRTTLVTEHAVNEPSCVTERMTYADSRIEFNTHNQCGQLIRHDDTAGSLSIDEYGLSGTILCKSRRFMIDLLIPDWSDIETERDKKLELEIFTTRWLFNTTNDLLSQTDARRNQQVLGYNVAGQVRQIQLKREGLPERTLVSNLLYSATGQIESETVGNGVEITRCYEAESNRLLRLTSRRPGHTFQDHHYFYDPVGNISRILDSAQTVRYFSNQRTEPLNTYKYDSLYQLIEATGRESVPASQGPALPELQTPLIDPQRMSTYKQTFSYDAAGNLYTVVHDGRSDYTREMVTAPSSNRSLLRAGNKEPDFNNSFDHNGNLQTLLPGAQTLRWNTRNQLSEVIQVLRDNAQDDDEVYIYDGQGQRLRKTLRARTKSGVRSADVRYLPGLEVHYNNAVEVRHVMNIEASNCSVRVLHWDEEPPIDIVNNQIRYNLSDHLGSSTLELDEEAGLLSQEGYYPFGGTAWWAARNLTEAKYKTIRYSGTERDTTGLYYYGFRYYAHWLQRWINPDPAGNIDGLNYYKMVQNNPLRLKDSKGLAPIEPIDEHETKMLAAGQAILYRRADHLPSIDKAEFLEDYATMLQFTKKAISALSAPNLSDSTLEKLKNIFGTDMQEEHLKLAADAARKKLEKTYNGGLKDQATGDRFVFTENNPQKPVQRAHRHKSKKQGTEIVYLNLKAREQSAPRRAGTMFHELTHVHAKTADFWYLFPSSGKNDTAATIEGAMNTALEKSRLMAEKGPDQSKLKDKNKIKLMKHIEKAQKNFHSPEAQVLNAKIAITVHNADSLAALALQFRH
ncbi:RHS repeat domain-containing protein [Pseudomonas fluorescens]|uniref:RHS repeat domain-containing protein n=1 Tax=Pseudomonas fluorescens TaxID=294 RepID=UPI00123F33BC|nr:RHS repeat-associated core domain-containing protein [Pseudomonas fluorescens]VVM84294.1 hypothetical protein PS639_02437 [Pseudomonas fluorescens]